MRMVQQNYNSLSPNVWIPFKTCLPKKKPVLSALSALIVSQHFSDLEYTQKRLIDATQKLERVVSGRSKLRGSNEEKALKIKDLRNQISILEGKVATIQSAALDSYPLPGEPSDTTRTIMKAISASDSLQVKQEQLELNLSTILKGPGSSEHDPMLIDYEMLDGYSIYLIWLADHLKYTRMTVTSLSTVSEKAETMGKTLNTPLPDIVMQYGFRLLVLALCFDGTTWT